MISTFTKKDQHQYWQVSLLQFLACWLLLSLCSGGVCWWRLSSAVWCPYCASESKSDTRQQTSILLPRSRQTRGLWCQLMSSFTTRNEPAVQSLFVFYVMLIHHLVVPRHNLSTYGRWAFTFAGLDAWNSLSDDLLDPALSTDSFRRLLKTRLFSGY